MWVFCIEILASRHISGGVQLPICTNSLIKVGSARKTQLAQLLLFGFESLPEQGTLKRQKKTELLLANSNIWDNSGVCGKIAGNHILCRFLKQ